MKTTHGPLATYDLEVLQPHHRTSGLQALRGGALRPPTSAHSLQLREVYNTSVSSWRAVHSAHAIKFLESDQAVTAKSKLEIFSERASLKRPNTIPEKYLANLSFYAFWRMFYQAHGKLHRRQQERFISVTGAGHPKQASRSDPQHETYARRTLYAYMPCDGLRGIEYIDVICADQFETSWTKFLKAFVSAPTNKWCPAWISRKTTNT